MTREEAINIMKVIVHMLEEKYDTDRVEDAVDMAIEALSAEPCEDCISRAEAIKAIEEYGSVWMEYTEEMSIHQIAERALKASKQSMYKILHDLPSVQPKPKTGHWINIEDKTDWYDATYKCSCCGREIITPYELKNNLYSDYPYCHCGAKMESEDKE